MPANPTILDGAIGTELLRLGHALDTPAWSARILVEDPEAIAELHRAYASAGATVHSACTFRVRRLANWRRLAEAAASLTRSAVPAGHRVAGSIGPIEDCYRRLTAGLTYERQHAELAEVLAPHVDLLLCETFPTPEEAVAATRAATATGREVWTSLTAGPWANLMTPDELRGTAERCLAVGATHVLVNCVSASQSTPFVRALAGLPFGVYANVGAASEGMGFCPAPDVAAFAAHAARWHAMGARILGGCCGTSPAHIRAICDMLGSLHASPEASS